MRNARSACLAFVLASCAGCASIIHGGIQEIRVTSDPSQAVLFMNDRPVGMTPTSVVVKRRAKDVVFRVEKDGLVGEQRLDRKVSGLIGADVAVSLNPMAVQGLNSWSQWPALIANALAWTVGLDFLTGAAYTHPSTVHVVLTPKESLR